MATRASGASEVIHLDTSFLIRALQGSEPEEKRLAGWLRAEISVAMSTIAWAEFLCGPVDRAQLALAQQVVPTRVALGDHEASLAAELFNRSGRRRGLMIDCMIAATAIEAGASLATANVEDFLRFAPSGLILVT